MPKRRSSKDARIIARWDIGGLVAAFGGIEPLIQEHTRMGFEPVNYSQVTNWRLRGAVPADRLAELFVTLENVSGKFDIWPYIRGAE